MPDKTDIKTLKTNHKHATILDVRIDSTSVAEVLNEVEQKITKKQKFYIVTPNPEIVIQAQYDQDLKNILNSADISLPDGIGLLAAHRFNILPRPKDPIKRLLTLLVQGLGVGYSILFDMHWLTEDFKLLKGREVFMNLIGLSDRKGWKIYLLGGKSREAELAAKKLQNEYKNLEVKSSPGPILDKEGMPTTKKQKETEIEIEKEINKFEPDLLFVGMGAPKQEKWMYRQLPKLTVGGAMVVGGTFNYISGQRKLPPKFFADRGLEWLWRLINGTQITNRVWQAFPEFAFEVFKNKYSAQKPG